jgi:hypothetical protein
MIVASMLFVLWYLGLSAISYTDNQLRTDILCISESETTLCDSLWGYRRNWTSLQSEGLVPGPFDSLFGLITRATATNVSAALRSLRSGSYFLYILVDPDTVKRLELDLSDIGSTYVAFIGCVRFNDPQFLDAGFSYGTFQLSLGASSDLHGKLDYLVMADCSVELLTPVRIPAVNLLLSNSPTLLSNSFAHFDYAIARLDFVTSVSSAVGEVGFWLGSLARNT